MEGVLKSIRNPAQTLSDAEQAEKKFARQLLADIEAVSAQLEAVGQKYNLTNDEDLIDSLIYQELALKARYSYLLRQAREKNIRYQGNYISD